MILKPVFSNLGVEIDGSKNMLNRFPKFYSEKVVGIAFKLSGISGILSRIK